MHWEYSLSKLGECIHHTGILSEVHQVDYIIAMNIIIAHNEIHSNLNNPRCISPGDWTVYIIYYINMELHVDKANFC